MILDALEVDALVCELLYPFEGGFDFRADGAVDRVAWALINRTRWSGGVENYAEALAVVARTGDLPEHARSVGDRYSETDRFAFLDLLRNRLDELRPWPAPAFRKMPTPGTWDELGVSRAVARIDIPQLQLEGVFVERFDRVAAGAAGLPVILLALRTGEVVAVVGSSGSFTLMQRGDDDPATVVGHFVELTEISPEKVSRL